MDNNYLVHWGIKGMKWGKRRYQNADGSLTDAGKKRYADQHEDYRRAHDGRSVKQLSDRELRERNNRLQMEQQHAQLTKKTNVGKAAVSAFIAGAGTLTAAVKAYETYKKYGNKSLDAIGDWVVKGIDFTKPLA